MPPKLRLCGSQGDYQFFISLGVNPVEYSCQKEYGSNLMSRRHRNRHLRQHRTDPQCHLKGQRQQHQPRTAPDTRIIARAKRLHAEQEHEDGNSIGEHAVVEVNSGDAFKRGLAGFWRGFTGIFSIGFGYTGALPGP